VTVGEVRPLLEIERDLERSFAADEAAIAREPKGWPPALILFHCAQWRARLRDALVEFEAGREYAHPGNVDEINDRELPQGDGVALSTAAARSDALLGDLIALSSRLASRYFQWSLTRTCGDAIVRNSYFHPRVHLAAYWQENGEDRRAHQLMENTVGELRELWPAPIILGAGLYNLATVRVAQDRADEALDLLEEAGPMRPDILAQAAGDPDLAALRGNARFQALTTQGFK
jgi:hypothetical protein